MPQQSRLKIADGFFPITFTPLFNLLCLLFMFMVVAPFLVFPTTVEVKLPKSITSDIIQENTTTITITSEDVIYFEKKVVTNRELKKILQSPSFKKRSILIKADGRSSLARIIDVWNVCRELNLEKVNIATSINK